MSDAFIREVDEDLRQKQLQNIWKKYGKFVIGVAIGIVVIVAGRAIYTNTVEGKYKEQAQAFSSALKLEGAAVSAALDQIIASDVDGYEIVATFKKAELALEAADKLGAIKVYDDFISGATVPQVYKDIANIQAAILELDSASVDTINGRLGLIANGETPFQFMAAELIALSELNAGDAEAAKTRFEGLIGNVDAPNSIKNRAEQYLSVIE